MTTRSHMQTHTVVTGLLQVQPGAGKKKNHNLCSTKILEWRADGVQIQNPPFHCHTTLIVIKATSAENCWLCN